ncbi:MAG TPA: hypothetical protein VFO52_00435, partial [Longimicrobiales bacterium]|nr:hypothetical protein [Longimicrobiales bacterium]
SRPSLSAAVSIRERAHRGLEKTAATKLRDKTALQNCATKRRYKKSLQNYAGRVLECPLFALMS